MTSKKTKKTSNIDDLFEILQGMDALDIPCQRLRTVRQLKLNKRCVKSVIKWPKLEKVTG